MSRQHNETLQSLCRGYLTRLRHIGVKYGINVDEIIRLNQRKECEGTELEVQMLSRMLDDERVSRADIPKILGKSYRQANEDGDFEKIKKLRHIGIYSKVSTLLLKSKQKKLKDGNKR